MRNFMVLLMGISFIGFMKQSVLAQNRIDFGPVRIGTGQMDTLKIHNANLLDLFVTEVTVSEPVFHLPALPFSGDVIQIPPDSTQVWPVVFKPQALHNYNGIIRVQANQNVDEILLSGEGVREVVVINEILADPPTGLSGDANGDGLRDTNHDEFVELLNTGRYPIPIDGWQLSDANTAPNKRFAFPANTWIGPGERIVLFGGGNPVGTFGKTFVDDGRIGGGLSNTEDTVLLFSQEITDTLSVVAYGSEGGKDQSVIRYPEGWGKWMLHGAFPGRGDLFSPGSARVVLSDLVVFPQDTSIAVGDTLAFWALGLYTDGGQILADDFITWFVSDSLRVAKLSDGRWRGNLSGQVEIWAQVEDITSNKSRIEIKPPEVIDMMISPVDTIVLVGDTLSLGVEGQLSDGSFVKLLDGVSWNMDSMHIAKVDDGKIIGLKPGWIEGIAGYQNIEKTFVVRFVARGDLNEDGQIDLLDAIRSVHLILKTQPNPSSRELRSADLDANGNIDIRDLVGIIQLIWGKNEVEKPAVINPEGIWWTDGKKITAKANVVVQALFVEWHGGPIAINDLAETAILGEQVETNEGLRQGVFYYLHDHSNDTLELFFENMQCDIIRISATNIYGHLFELKSMSVEKDLIVYPPFPNPFNPFVTLRFYLPEPQFIAFRVFTPAGQLVRQLVIQFMTAGLHDIVWDGRDDQGRTIGSGVYLGVLKGDHVQNTAKILLLR